MSKSRPVCKPAKLAGSGRKLIRVFSDSTTLEDNDCMRTSKEICYGLAIFHATFGFDNNKQESLFHGFSPHEIRLATDKSKIRTIQVAREHKARGVLYIPYTQERSPLVPTAASRKCESDVQTPPWDEKRFNHSKNVLSNKNITKKKNLIDSDSKVLRTKIHGRKTIEKSNIEVNSRSNVRKFVLPVRSAHSSRVIKPNKRFRDNDVETESCDTKKLRQASKTLNNNSASSSVKKRTEESCQPSSDVEDNDMTERSSSSASTASSNFKHEDFLSRSKRVILRKSKLKVEPNPPAVKGPFSSGELIPQKVVCGVCGAVRYYRHLKQARKFGIYSCESCRKFITRTISDSRSDTMICKIGKGKCTIPQYMKDPLTGLTVSHGNSRCKACWLKMCLHCYCMPDDLKFKLIRRLPISMRDEEPKKHEDDQKRKNKLRILKRSLNSSVLPNRVTNKVVEKQINLAISIRKKAEAIARKETNSKRKKSSNVVNTKPQCREISKKVSNKCTTSDIGLKRRGINGKKAVKLNIKQKKLRKEKVKREEKLVRLHKLKGPRVKHVCRSASLVLGQPVATFTDTSPSKQRNHSSGNDENNSKTLTPSENYRNSNEMVGHSSFKPVEFCSRIRQSSDNSSDVHAGKSKSTVSKILARTLQDLTRQHYELINGAASEDNVDLISIDFWESYDPDEVSKTGFALIGSDDAFTITAVCFICGSAGLDKLIHCACCCEPYHHYCVEGTVSQTDTDDWWLVDWVCTRCTLCHTCGKGGGTQVACQKCRKSHHTECLAADRLASRLHSADRPWVCLSCLCCKSCNHSEVYKFVGNLPLCKVCFKLRQKGNFCPLCQSCYDENDFDTKMMECERCKCWVHAKCEGLSNEKYQILSILPDSIEFVCRLCCKIPPASWWLAVEAEMKAGFLAVLKSLSKNRRACALLKWSPTKGSPVCVCGNGLVQNTLRFPDLSEQSDAESADMRLNHESQKSEKTAREECLKSLQILPTGSDENLVLNSKSEIVNKHTCDLRTRYNVRECSVVVKHDDLQLKLDSDIISYQIVDDKPSQFSPHATSQSDSGIGSTDDELKSTNDQCLCLGLDSWTKTPPTLLTVKRKVNSNEYSSLSCFNKEMEEIINRVQGTELLQLYYQTLEDIFPWFNRKCSEVYDPTTRINLFIDSGKTVQSNPEEKPEGCDIEDVCITLKGNLNRGNDYYYNVDQSNDYRRCGLCKLTGEGREMEEGRLLYCGQNEWIHTNCALWSNEVFEEIDGSLQNVQSAVSRSRHIRCCKCSKKGASIGCCNRSCPEAYHFGCARENDCLFFEDKSFFCINHKSEAKDSRPLVTGEDFLVTRPVYVELERRKKKYIARHNVRIMIGSLTINSLGEFIPDISDQEYSIIPCNFHCTRMFWSCVEPWRLVEYNIRTKIVYTISDTSIENDKNFTIDHSLHENANDQRKNLVKMSQGGLINNYDVKEVMEHILDIVSSRDDEDPQASADLLPPEVKEAIFEDLPHDLLDGISMQDIFPKLMNFDSSTLEVKPNKEHKTTSFTKSTRLNIVKQKPTYETFSNISQKLITKGEIGKKSDNQANISWKRKSKFPNENHISINKLEEKENATKWISSKIIQIDGTGDCSSESSDLGSPVADEPYTPILHVRLQQVGGKESFKTQNCRKPRILQVDGVVDSCTSSCSSSECGSPGRDDGFFWKIAQVDGAMDLCSSKDSELLEENPVKCTRCHRTYRTAQSFERHLQTCSVDYILSCSESDSSEEDKISGSEVKLSEVEEGISSPFCIDNSDVIFENKDKIKENTFITNLEQHPLYECPSQPNDLNIVPFQSSQLRTYNNKRLGSNKNTKTPTSVQQPMNVSSHNHNLATETFNLNNLNSNINKSVHLHSYAAKPKTMRAMFECDEPKIMQHSEYERTPVTIRPVKTYSRRKKVSTSTTSTMSVPKTSQQEPMMEYQTSSASPALIIQQVPSHNIVPSYIENLPTQANSNNFQYQYIATIDMQDKSPVPLAIQLQPQISIQPVMPTVLGTIIQPNGLKQLVVNTAPHTVEMLNQQPANVYITNVNQPMYVGMETVVSNTVMSSSQFVSGVLSGSSYSATTTQVYQTAKPVIDLPQSFVVVNTQTNPVPDTLPQTVYSPHDSQHWTYNYQIKERTTYQQVTRQIIQEENNVNCLQMSNSAEEEVFLKRPLGQQVTLEKSHSIYKSVPVSIVQSSINTNPLLGNEIVTHGHFSHDELLLDKNMAINEEKPKLGLEKESTHKQTCNENPIEMKSTKLTIGDYIDKSQKNMAKFTDSRGKNDVLEKPTKPVITKVKSNPNVKICNFNVNLSNNKSNASNVCKLVQSVTEKQPVLIGNKPVELHNGKTECSSYNTSGKDESNKVELLKEIDERRIPLKENKITISKSKNNSNSLKQHKYVNNPTNPKLVFEISSQEGISICSQNLAKAWQKVFEAVQSARAAKRLPPLPHNPLISQDKMLGLDNNSVKYLIEQLPGIGKCKKYKPTYHKTKQFSCNDQLYENPTGCARSEPCSNTRRKYDMFSWLASRHRCPPKLIINSDTEIVNGISRRATSLNLPMAMRFRHLKETSKEAVGVFRSDIHGRGLFCLRDIDCGEMVIEYAGEVIRAGLTDKREHFYTSKGIGCYMFRIDDQFVVDATMHGNAARFINHSCEPNCYSRVVDILGKKHILIFALRKIPQGEELTYDYKFPLEDDKITCHCLSRKCRKYLN